MRALLFALFLGLLAGCGRPREADIAWEVVEKADKGAISIVVRMERRKLSILESQHLELEVSAPEAFKLEIPDPASRLEDFRLVPWRASVEEHNAGRQVFRKYVALELYESGPQVVPPFEIRYSSGAGEKRIAGELKTAILKFEITPVEASSPDQRTLKPPEGLLRPDPFPWVWVSVAGLAGLLVLGGGGWLLLQRRRARSRPPPPPPPAHALAYDELERLVQAFKAKDLGAEGFVAESSNILRRYVERRFAIKAPELTSEEFLNSLRDHPLLREHRTPLQSVLEAADLVKFAAAAAGEPEVRNSFEAVKAFIESTRERAPA